MSKTDINLINSEDIPIYLKKFCANDQQSDRLCSYLLTALEKALSKESKYIQIVGSLPDDAPEWMRKGWGDREFHKFVPSPALDIKVRHIKDWILSAMVRGESWLERVDDQGRVLKLLKIGSIKQALKEADKAFEMQRQTFDSSVRADVSFSYELEHDDIAIVHHYPDEFRMVKLLSTVAAGRETHFMQHCVGNGAYESVFSQGHEVLSSSIYSLRDRKNDPHVTLEIDDTTLRVLQCVGKQNEPPAEKYVDYLMTFFYEFGVDLTDFAQRNGYVFHDGKAHSVEKLPDDIEIEGDFDITPYFNFHCPKGLHIQGDFTFDTLQRPFIKPCLSAERFCERIQVSEDVMKFLVYRGFIDVLYGEYWYERFSGKMVLHRADAPAQIMYDADTGGIVDELWYFKGELHRDDGPAAVFYDSHGNLERQVWYKHGEVVRNKKIEKKPE